MSEQSVEITFRFKVTHNPGSEDHLRQVVLAWL